MIISYRSDCKKALSLSILELSLAARANNPVLPAFLENTEQFLAGGLSCLFCFTMICWPSQLPPTKRLCWNVHGYDTHVLTCAATIWFSAPQKETRTSRFDKSETCLRSANHLWSMFACQVVTMCLHLLQAGCNPLVLHRNSEHEASPSPSQVYARSLCLYPEDGCYSPLLRILTSHSPCPFWTPGVAKLSHVCTRGGQGHASSSPIKTEGASQLFVWIVFNAVEITKNFQETHACKSTSSQISLLQHSSLLKALRSLSARMEWKEWTEPSSGDTNSFIKDASPHSGHSSWRASCRAKTRRSTRQEQKNIGDQVETCWDQGTGTTKQLTRANTACNGP